jgi:serine/threonine-protein kinase RsbW
MRNDQIFMLKLPSEPSSISLLEAFVERIVLKYKIQPDLYGNILISLTEAVNNAIIHGNQRDRQKKVLIGMQKMGRQICFKVSDEGRGFDFSNLPDPTAPENRCECGGRGVYIIQNLADDVAFHDNGSTVELQFKL